MDGGVKRQKDGERKKEMGRKCKIAKEERTRGGREGRGGEGGLGEADK